MSAGRKVAVVAPTYNEAENLPELASRLFALDGVGDLRLYIVDDASPDGTADAARALSERYGGGIEVISRSAKLGLGTAYIAGFSRALADGCDRVVQMDADLSHAPEHIPTMLKILDEGGDDRIVIGSRYAPGGSLDPSWGRKRRFLSAFGNHLIRFVTGLRAKDVTGGFRAYPADVLRAVDFASARCAGFAFQAELAYMFQAAGFGAVEHPITFMDRTRGESKMSLHIVAEAVWKLALIRFRGG